jgi:hypothetical protein
MFTKFKGIANEGLESIKCNRDIDRKHTQEHGERLHKNLQHDQPLGGERRKI